MMDDKDLSQIPSPQEPVVGTEGRPSPNSADSSDSQKTEPDKETVNSSSADAETVDQNSGSCEKASNQPSPEESEEPIDSEQNSSGRGSHFGNTRADNFVGNVTGNVIFNDKPHFEETGPREPTTFKLEEVPDYDKFDLVERELKAKTSQLKQQFIQILVYDDNSKRECHSAGWALIEALREEDFDAYFANEFIDIAKFAQHKRKFAYTSPTVTHIDASECQGNAIQMLLRPEWLNSTHLTDNQHYLIYIVHETAYQNAKNNLLASTDTHIWSIKSQTKQSQADSNVEDNKHPFDPDNLIQANVQFCATFLPELNRSDFFSIVNILLEHDQQLVAEEQYQPDYLKLWQSSADKFVMESGVSFQRIKPNEMGYVLESSQQERSMKRVMLYQYPQFSLTRLDIIREVFISSDNPSRTFIEGFARLLIDLERYHGSTVTREYLAGLLEATEQFASSKGLRRLTLLLKKLFRSENTQNAVKELLASLVDKCRTQQKQWRSKHVFLGRLSVDSTHPIWNTRVIQKAEANDTSIQFLATLENNAHQYNFIVQEVCGYQSYGAQLLAEQIITDVEPAEIDTQIHISWYYPIRFIALWWFSSYVTKRGGDIELVRSTLKHKHIKSVDKHQVYATYLDATFALLADQLPFDNSKEEAVSENLLSLVTPNQAALFAEVATCGWTTGEPGKKRADLQNIAKLYALLALVIGDEQHTTSQNIDSALKHHAGQLVERLLVRERRRLFERLGEISELLKSEYYELKDTEKGNSKYRKNRIMALEQFRQLIKSESQKLA